MTCFWSNLWGQLWTLTSLGRSDWMFSNIIPNHPQVCNLKSFWHVFEVTSKVNFGLWPLLVGQIKYSQISSQNIHNFKQDHPYLEDKWLRYSTIIAFWTGNDDTAVCLSSWFIVNVSYKNSVAVEFRLFTYIFLHEKCSLKCLVLFVLCSLCW